MTVPDVAFVCCIESGSLEDPTVRMIESLRRFGGAFAHCQIVAVTPRFSFPLHHTTRTALDRLNVDYLYRPERNHRYCWFNFLNKPLSLIFAKDIIKCSIICWIDSDIIVVAEPFKLLLGKDEDIVACPADIQEMGSKGPGDKFECLWEYILEANGLSPDSFPWTKTCYEGVRIRLYWNGGIFAFRATSAFAQQYFDATVRALDTRIISARDDYSLGLNEMSAIGIAAVQLGLRRRELPFTHNYTISPSLKEWRDDDRLAAARIVHYHHSMWPDHWLQFLSQMRYAHPEVGKWLSHIGPMRNPAKPTTRLANRILKISRNAGESAYRARCRVV